MRSYFITVKDLSSIDGVVAITNGYKKAARLIADLEVEDKYLGLYEPNRYTIIVDKDYERETVRTR